MIFVNESGEGVEIETTRPSRVRIDRTDSQRRILRDRAMLLLRRAGLSFGEILETCKAFAHAPIKNRAHVEQRIVKAEQYATWEAEKRGLLDTD